MSQSTRICRNEVSLLPPCLDDFVDEDNPVRALDFYIEGLDLEALGFQLKGKCALGRPVDYSGKDLLKLLIYGYLNQIRSSRKLEAETSRNLEVIWLLENARPKFWTINQFRKDNCAAFKNVLHDFHKVCEQLELFGKELIAIDGAFFKARNNSSRNFTKAKLAKMGAKIDAAIDAWNNAMDDEDPIDNPKAEPASESASEPVDTTTGEDQANESREKDLFGECVNEGEQEDEVPQTVPQSAKNLKAQGTLEELEAKKARVEKLKEMAEQSPSGQVSLTDEDSRLLKKSGQCLVGHNVQSAIDSKHHMIADLDIVQAGSDNNQLQPMVESACAALEITPSPEEPIDCAIDGGYYNASQMQHCEENGVRVFIPTIKKNTNHELGFGIEDFTYNEETDEYICPAQKPLIRHSDTKTKEITYQVYYNTSACRDCPFLEKCTKGKYRKLRISEYRETEEKIAARMLEEPEKYAQRKELAEHPFGTMKAIWGYAQFMVTGHPGCKGELSLMGFSYNWKRALKIVGMEKLMEAIALFIGLWTLKSIQRALQFRSKRFHAENRDFGGNTLNNQNCFSILGGVFSSKLLITQSPKDVATEDSKCAQN